MTGVLAEIKPDFAYYLPRAKVIIWYIESLSINSADEWWVEVMKWARKKVEGDEQWNDEVVAGEGCVLYIAAEGWAHWKGQEV